MSITSNWTDRDDRAPSAASYGRVGLGYGFLGAGLLGFFCLSLAYGSVRIPVAEVLSILFGEEAARSSWRVIIFDIRLPKALTATLAGSALAVSGLQMQTLFRNPLAGPFVLGISAGAGLGVAIVVLSVGAGVAVLVAGLGFLGNFGLAAAASCGAGLALGVILLVSRWIDNSMTLLIIGLMFGYAAGALVSVLVYFSASEAVQAYLIWTFGSFGGVTWSQLQVLFFVSAAGLAISVLYSKPLNALLLGEHYAASMGLSVRRARLMILSSASLLAGVTTAFCGPIAFLGVAVPHLTRSLFGTSDHRLLLPAVCLCGAILALLSDLVARLPGSSLTLPLNAVTALIGAPVVTWVILKRRNLRASFGS
ncbi:TPA: iron ABC transporter [Candidatus Latescibacteria bacterium]|nr:iron ABC transporter [Candidatus Latescibacterota bacterium]